MLKCYDTGSICVFLFVWLYTVFIVLICDLFSMKFRGYSFIY